MKTNRAISEQSIKTEKEICGIFKRDNFAKISDELKHKNFNVREIPFCGGIARVYCILQLTNREALGESVIKPFIAAARNNKIAINAESTIDKIIYADDCRVENDFSKTADIILSGLTVILFSNDDKYIVINLKQVEHRSVPTPQLTYTSRGPQDCFTENMDVNLSLVRYRLKDKNLKIDQLEVGRRTKSKVAVIYIDDIANKNVVNKIKERITKIDVDGIAESGELQSFLLNGKYKIFPNMGLVERSDLSCHAVLEGKVLVLVDGSGVGLIAPKVFFEFLTSSDDRYDNKFFGVLARTLRYISVLTAFTASSIFVAITSYNTDVLPSKYAISLAEMRANVPISAFAGAIIMEIVIELLREALIRVPKHIGSAVGIVGAIVIGEAAISAGIFSPLLLIIGSLSLMASFVIPDYSLINAFRVLKFGLVIATGFFGFFGFTLFCTLTLCLLVNNDSFGVPYLSPYAPFNLYDFVRTIIYNTTMSIKRPNYLNDKDKIRLKKK